MNLTSSHIDEQKLEFYFGYGFLVASMISFSIVSCCIKINTKKKKSRYPNLLVFPPPYNYKTLRTVKEVEEI